MNTYSAEAQANSVSIRQSSWQSILPTTPWMIRSS